ncbi:hypothetical protein KX816_06680 [Sphingosinicellaceae bacterium]|nr:hypothetical protein KX816_06680 [Sphingosinicellaceae bacterium]
MNISKIVGSIGAAAAAMLLVAGPVSARPSDHRGRKRQVCKIERHHGHRTKVCHWR